MCKPGKPYTKPTDESDLQEDELTRLQPEVLTEEPRDTTEASQSLVQSPKEEKEPEVENLAVAAKDDTLSDTPESFKQVEEPSQNTQNPEEFQKEAGCEITVEPDTSEIRPQVVNYTGEQEAGPLEFKNEKPEAPRSNEEVAMHKSEPVHKKATGDALNTTAPEIKDSEETTTQSEKSKDEGNAVLSAKEKRKAKKKEKKRQSQNLNIGHGTSIITETAPNSLERTLRDSSAPEGTTSTENVPHATNEAETPANAKSPGLSLETEVAPAEDDGKDNQSHDTGIHGMNDKDLIWTDDIVSSQVEQRQTTLSAYPPLPVSEHGENPLAAISGQEERTIGQVAVGGESQLQTVNEPGESSEADKEPITTPAESIEEVCDDVASVTAPMQEGDEAMSERVRAMSEDEEKLEMPEPVSTIEELARGDGENTAETPSSRDLINALPLEGEENLPDSIKRNAMGELPEESEEVIPDTEEFGLAALSSKMSKKGRKKLRKAQKAVRLSQNQGLEDSSESKGEETHPAASEQPTDSTTHTANQETLVAPEDSVQEAKEDLESQESIAQLPVSTVDENEVETTVKGPYETNTSEASLGSNIPIATEDPRADTVGETLAPGITERDKSSKDEIEIEKSSLSTSKWKDEAMQEEKTKGLLGLEELPATIDVAIDSGEPIDKERSAESSQPPEVAHGPLSKNKEFSEGDLRPALEEVLSQKTQDVSQETHEKASSEPLSRKESKGKKKAKKNVKRQSDASPGPDPTEVEIRQDIIADLAPEADFASGLPAEESKWSPGDVHSTIEHINAEHAESYPIMDPLVRKDTDQLASMDNPSQSSQEILEEKQEEPRADEEMAIAEDSVGGDLVELDATVPVSRKQSRKEKKKAKKKGKQETIQVAQEPEPESTLELSKDHTEDQHSATKEPMEDSRLQIVEGARMDEGHLSRASFQEEAMKEDGEDVKAMDVEAPTEPRISSEEPFYAQEEPMALGGKRYSHGGDSLPSIDWEKDKLAAERKALESAMTDKSTLEIPQNVSGALDSSVEPPAEATRQVEHEPYLDPALHVVHETESAKPPRRRDDKLDGLSHKQSKVASVFPNLARGSFRLPVPVQSTQSVKDGAEDETLDHQEVSEAPIPTADSQVSRLSQEDTGFQGEQITSTNRNLSEETTANYSQSIHPEGIPVDAGAEDVNNQPKERSRSVGPQSENEKNLRAMESNQAEQVIPELFTGNETPSLYAPKPIHKRASTLYRATNMDRPSSPDSYGLRHNPSIHGRHNHPLQPWSLEDPAPIAQPRTLSPLGFVDGQQSGPSKEAVSPPRTPLQTITEDGPRDRGSGTRGTPCLEMKPEHILPRPETPVRKFTDNALARQSWPTPERDHIADEDEDIGLKKHRRTVDSKWPMEIQTPEQGMPILRPTGSASSIRSLQSVQSARSLRRMGRSTSGDLRAAAASQPPGSQPPPHSPLPTDLNIERIASSSSYDPVTDKGKRPLRAMTDVYEGWGETPSSPRSPSRPPSIRHRRSMQHLQELESRLDQLISENRLLIASRDAAEEKLRSTSVARRKSDHALNTSDANLRDREAEVEQLKSSVDWLQKEVARLTEENEGLTTANSNLTVAHATAIQTVRESSTRELNDLRLQNHQLASNVQDQIRQEVDAALSQKNLELRRLREELENARDKVKELQQQITTSMNDNVLVFRDEDYFDAACQKLCGHVQQWVLRFSKHSDHHRCRKLGDLQDEKVADRFDNAILDGSDADTYLADRVHRRDVFMSVVMTMVWEYIFTRYLFGMDREQRQKLKSLEKQLAEVGQRNAIHRWRATTLTMLSKRPTFSRQRDADTEAVALEIFETLSRLLPPPTHVESQLLDSLRRVLRVAVSLSVEMRTQLAEYIMLPPLQPEYDTNGDLARQVHFNASLMNERSGETTSNEELELQQAVVRVVLFPLVVKKGNDMGEGEDEVVVCPAQVLVARPFKDKRVVKMLSGDRMSFDANKSVHSVAPSSTMDMSNVI
ncbi:hypothetical protein EYZ11_012168 [Aspergillus tanneri]|uniref:Involucrin repeat protein n=1 Tax=Aspergillus tanneri TaxID=1220188 RepID=A0A4V3UMS3_9EURO|nr:hypothetical protein EYZ11_012168 [Aspergillus tanneri]